MAATGRRDMVMPHAAEFSANIGIVPWLTLFKRRKYHYLWYNSDMAFFKAELTKYWDPVLKELHQMEQSGAIFLKEESRIKRSRGSQILVHAHHRTLQQTPETYDIVHF